MTEHLMGREELIEVGGKALVTSFAETFEGGGWDEPPRWEDYDEQEHKRFLMAFEAALSAIEGAGFVVVPREPTEAMLRAAFVAMNETPGGTWKRLKAEGVTPRRLFDVKMAPRYRAMISAYSPQTRGEQS